MLFKEPANMQLAKTNGLTSVKKFSSNVQTLVAGENVAGENLSQNNNNNNDRLTAFDPGQPG